MTTDADSFIVHAEKFGIDCVEQTGRLFLSPLDFVKLKLELQRIAAKHSKNREHVTWWERPPKITDEDVSLLREAGSTVSEIAQAIGKPEKAVLAALSRVDNEEKSLVELAA